MNYDPADEERKGDGTREQPLGEAEDGKQEEAAAAEGGDDATRFVIITGMSGAGKSEAMRSFEDLGYFCVDNLPPELIPKFAELLVRSGGHLSRIALVSDIRGGAFFDHLFDALNELEQVGFGYTILFLEAADDVLVRRFKETRRRHPLMGEGTILDGIGRERRRLAELRRRARLTLDTSTLTPRELKETIRNHFVDNGVPGPDVTVMSFGFKHGVPIDADLVFDVRFLPNPHWVDELRPLTGRDVVIDEYVFADSAAGQFMDKVEDLLDFLMEQYAKEARNHILVGIGCTGGRHRSVAVSLRLAELLRARGLPVTVHHRDLDE